MCLSLAACGPKSSDPGGTGGVTSGGATTSSGSGGGGCPGASILGSWSAQADGKPTSGQQAFFTPGSPPAFALYDGSGQVIVQFTIAGATGPGMYTVTSGKAGDSFTFYPTGSIPTGGQYSLFPGDSATVNVTSWPAAKKSYGSGTFSATVHNGTAGPNGEAIGALQKTINAGEFCAQWH